MSLGFNPNRRHRVTTLPGGVSTKPVIPAALLPVPIRAPPPASVKPIPNKKNTSPGLTVSLSSPPWVYGIAQQELKDEDSGTIVASQGDKVMLVYPMTEDNDRILMQMKCIHPVTAQLSYAKVVVYDGNSETRAVTDFSLC